MAREDFQSLPRGMQALLRGAGIGASSVDARTAKRLARLWANLPGMVQRIGREGVRRAARQAQELYSSSFSRQLYYRQSGRLARLGRNTPAYNKAKANQGMDRRRGHRTGKLAEAIDSMVSVTPSQRGLRIALRAAANRTGAGAYLDYYEEAKAPGLGDPTSLPRVVLRDFYRYVYRHVRLEASRVLDAPGMTGRLLSVNRVAAILESQGFKLQRGVG